MEDSERWPHITSDYTDPKIGDLWVLVNSKNITLVCIVTKVSEGNFLLEDYRGEIIEVNKSFLRVKTSSYRFDFRAFPITDERRKYLTEQSRDQEILVELRHALRYCQMTPEKKDSLVSFIKGLGS
jgi:hypothetical protein